MRPIDELLREGIVAGQFGGSLKPHGDHAMGFVSFSANAAENFVGHVVDIGSGAGLPALVLADAFPETTWTLVERRAGRTDLLRRAIRRLELHERMEVRTEDVAVAARSSLRGSADWVTARSFGPPGDTAECAAPLLRPAGELLTSEPFDSDIRTRWPAEGLARVDLELTRDWQTTAGRYAAFRRGDAELLDLPRKGSRKQSLF